jgi:hypothetical protein
MVSSVLDLIKSHIQREVIDKIMKNKIYLGCGSRETPEDIKELMRWAANKLFHRGYTLRSGGAPGADQSFEQGLCLADPNRSLIQHRSEIYLPWKKFEESNRSWIIPKRYEAQQEAYEIAERFHPSWKFLKHGAKMLHARNVHQILGNDVTNPVLSDFVICWTKDFKGQGGTGQAIRIADHYKVPVYDLANDDNYDYVVDMIVDV